MSETIRKQHRSLGTHVYRELIRPVLFSAYKNPEDAHEAMTRFFKGHYPSRFLDGYLDVGDGALSFTLGGKLALGGPIGLAAGFDKDGEMLKGLGHIFDYVTFGTALPYQWPGNPKTSSDNPSARRIVRLEKEESMLNCLGFPFEGLDGLLGNLGAYDGKTPLNASIAVRPPLEGQTMTAVINQFRVLVDSIAKYAPSKIRMVEANFASPNTKGLTVFFEEEVFEELANSIIKNTRLSAILKLLKLPPHTDESTRERNLDVARRWIALGGDGITIINTVRTQDPRLTVGAGGKSGRAVYEIMLQNLHDYREQLGMGPVINAVGGISADRVPEVLIDHGADTVQIYTPFIYNGPSYIRDAKINLLGALRERGFESMEALRAARRHTQHGA